MESWWWGFCSGTVFVSVICTWLRWPTERETPKTPRLEDVATGINDLGQAPEPKTECLDRPAPTVTDVPKTKCPGMEVGLVDRIYVTGAFGGTTVLNFLDGRCLGAKEGRVQDNPSCGDAGRPEKVPETRPGVRKFILVDGGHSLRIIGRPGRVSVVEVDDLANVEELRHDNHGNLVSFREFGPIPSNL